MEEMKRQEKKALEEADAARFKGKEGKGDRKIILLEGKGDETI